MATERRPAGVLVALLLGACAALFASQAGPTPTPAPTPGAKPAAGAAADTPATAPTDSQAASPEAATTPAAAAAPAEPPACTDCHGDDQGKTLLKSPHARLPLDKTLWGKPSAGPAKPPDAACRSCHGDALKHMESGGEDKTDLRVFKDPKTFDFCTTCHVESQGHASFKTGMHANSGTVNCATCHSIHSPDPKTAHLNTKPVQSLCQSCHPSFAASMRDKPFTHRPVAGIMDCTSCHDPHGRPGRESLKLTRAGEPPCLSCHTEKRGPFVFEHPTGLAADVASKCTTCHEPHGSSNPKQLVRARVDQLCLECHSQIAGGSATLGSQPPSFHNIALPRYRNCTTCHVAIHGSNLSPQLLK